MEQHQNKLNVTFVSIYLRTDEYDSKYTLASMRLAAFIQDLDNLNISIKPISLNCSAKEKEAFINELNDNADLICFSCYIWLWEFVKDLSSRIKRRDNRCILVGGPELKQRVPNDWFGDEIFVYGEGELVLREICSMLSQGYTAEQINQLKVIGDATKQGMVYRVPMDSKIKFRSHLYSDAFFEKVHMEEFNNKFIWYDTSRGCAYSCGYCGFRNRTGMVSYENDIITEEVKNIGKLHAERVFIVDANIGGIPERGKFVIKQFNMYSPDSKINAYLRPEFIDDEYMEILSNANIEELRIGVQTMNESVPKWLRNNCIQAVIDEIPKLTKAGVPWRAELIVGLPGDNFSGLEKSIRFLMDEVKPTYLYAYHLTILKETELYNILDGTGEYWIKMNPETNAAVSSNSYSEEELEYMLRFSNLITALYNRYIKIDDNRKYNVAPSFYKLKETVMSILDKVENGYCCKYNEAVKYWDTHILAEDR